eukprot:Skav226479  [mRNA]  locus=scaffold4441:84685:87127:- [translate_table: standard]
MRLQHVAMAAALMATLAEAATVPLLGGPRDWHFSSWKAITDQIRGGVSTAELVPVEGGARFQGKLDPSKLHAGFAGMNLDVKHLPVDFSELSGLQLDFLDADEFEYTLLVKLKGAKEGTSYQVRFVPKKSMPFDATFKEFQPYYRGHPDPSAPPLDKSQVETLAIQIASNFTGQSGAYKLDLKSISGYSFATEMFT